MNAVLASTPETQVPNTQAALNRFATFKWLIKRELWEHRGRFIITPLVVAALILIAFAWAMVKIDGQAASVAGEAIKMGTAGSGENVVKLRAFYSFASVGFAFPFLIVSFFVTLYYSLDTLYADRRDRSLLFWKSLPVSDLETVLSKLAIAVFVAPAITLALALATQYLVMIVVSIGFAARGQAISYLWTEMPYFQNASVLVYGLITIGLWYLPIWSWFMLVSSWAQRAPFLWATVPIAALSFFEYLTLGTHRVIEFLNIRFNGWEVAVGVPEGIQPEMQGQYFLEHGVYNLFTPGVYFSSPQLWIGFLMTAGFIAATVWVRRYRDAA